MGASTRDVATVGVAEHGNSAVLITLAAGGRFLDRRSVELTGPDLPTHPHHHEGSWAVGRYSSSPWARPIALSEAVALVERVREAASGLNWNVFEYDRDRVLHDAAAVLGGADVDAFLSALGRSIGPPWQARHKLATAASLSAMGRRPPRASTVER